MGGQAPRCGPLPAFAAYAVPLAPVGGGAKRSGDTEDILDRTDFVHHIVSVLDRVRQQGESSVIGLVADWGAGKSSVVNMTRRLLEEYQNEQSWLIAEYNPWNYSDFESLIMGFFAELRDAMPDNAQWGESREN